MITRIMIIGKSANNNKGARMKNMKKMKTKGNEPRMRMMMMVRLIGSNCVHGAAAKPRS